MSNRAVPLPIARYLQSRSVREPWRLAGEPGTGFRGAVVIPALAEADRLSATLASLAENPPELLEQFLVVVVVNHRTDASRREKEDNLDALRLLSEPGPASPLRLAWVDAATPGMELPAKNGGVGLARKIGMDLALNRLDFSSSLSPLLVCLDADTIVEPTYLQAILHHFRMPSAGGASIPFRHQPAESPQNQQAIDRYELFLRHYLLGLAIAGSPYAFHTVGSAMAATAEAYVRGGGMNTRQAGEDFYFLQHLRKVSRVDPLRGTTVYPSGRPSHRVPFGTGRSVSRTLAGEKDAISFYHPDCFRILKQWLLLVKGLAGSPAGNIMASAATIAPALAGYLETAGFPDACERLRQNHRSPAAFLHAFHCWFDGLRTMKLVHHLCGTVLERCEPEEALPPLFAAAGLPAEQGVQNWLEALRSHEDRCSA